MNKKNLILVAGTISVIAVIIGALAVYNAEIEENRQQGYEFGYNLQAIQEEVKEIQVNFAAKVKGFEEGQIQTDEFSRASKEHIQKLKRVIEKYDKLNPPEGFGPSVNLFKLSTVAQLQSDKEYIQWLKTGNESHRIRSDDLLQEAFEYEMAALSKYKQAQNNNNNDS